MSCTPKIPRSSEKYVMESLPNFPKRVPAESENIFTKIWNRESYVNISQVVISDERAYVERYSHTTPSKESVAAIEKAIRESIMDIFKTEIVRVNPGSRSLASTASLRSFMLSKGVVTNEGFELWDDTQKLKSKYLKTFIEVATSMGIPATEENLALSPHYGNFGCYFDPTFFPEKPGHWLVVISEERANLPNWFARQPVIGGV